MFSILHVLANSPLDVIHDHVPYRVEIPAMRAATKLNLPFVYEMRGMLVSQLCGVKRW